MEAIFTKEISLSRSANRVIGLTVFVALVFFIFGLYGLSAINQHIRLPFPKSGIFIISGIYFLRGMGKINHCSINRHIIFIRWFKTEQIPNWITIQTARIYTGLLHQQQTNGVILPAIVSGNLHPIHHHLRFPFFNQLKCLFR